MLTKQEMSRIRKLKQAIDALRIEVSDLEIGIQSPSLEDNGSSPSRNTKSSVETRAIRLAEVRELLEEKEAEYEYLGLQLDRDIREGKDEMLNAILTYRILLAWSWGRIARKMGSYSPEYLRKYYSRNVPS